MALPSRMGRPGERVVMSIDQITVQIIAAILDHGRFEIESISSGLRDTAGVYAGDDYHGVSLTVMVDMDRPEAATVTYEYRETVIIEGCEFDRAVTEKARVLLEDLRDALH